MIKVKSENKFINFLQIFATPYHVNYIMTGVHIVIDCINMRQKGVIIPFVFHFMTSFADEVHKQTIKVYVEPLDINL